MTTDNPQNETQSTMDPDLESQPTMEKPEMCCDGKTTAEEHRKSSPDGKCCIDN
jgi:hypothetical protein